MMDHRLMSTKTYGVIKISVDDEIKKDLKSNPLLSSTKPSSSIVEDIKKVDPESITHVWFTDSGLIDLVAEIEVDHPSKAQRIVSSIEL